MIENVNNSRTQEMLLDQKTSEKSVLLGNQQDVAKESINGSHGIQRQMLQLLANQQPLTQIQHVAQNQINKGYLDIKI